MALPGDAPNADTGNTLTHSTAAVTARTGSVSPKTITGSAQNSVVKSAVTRPSMTAAATRVPMG